MEVFDAVTSTNGKTRVHVVPDDDLLADTDIPREVLAALGPETILMSTTEPLLYVRASYWERIKSRFAGIP